MIGKLVTLEGTDGAGKTTQLGQLADWLRERGLQPVVTREPGGTPMGDRIREALFGGQDHGALPLTEALLMSAARAQHVEELIRPALARGQVVLSDRYADATLAYQAYGQGLSADVVRGLIALATGGLQPDLTLYLDVPVEVGQQRKQTAAAAGGELNHLDKMAAAFHERVAAGYLALAAAEPRRWRVIDAARPSKAVQADLRRELAGLLRLAL